MATDCRQAGAPGQGAGGPDLLNRYSWLTPALLAVSTAFAFLHIWQKQPRYYFAEPVIALHRMLNSGFLANDFYANTLDGYFYQYYFTLLGAAIARFGGISPDTTLAAIGLVSLIGLHLALLVGGRLLSGSWAAGALTTVFFATALFALGSLGPWLAFARPWSFVQPLVILALVLIVVGRPVAAMLTMGVASLFHPLVGAVMGALFLGAAWLANLFEAGRARRPLREVLFQGQIVLAALVLAALLLPNLMHFMLSLGRFKMSVAEFVATNIHYAHPQHYLVGYWKAKEIADFLLALGAGAILLMDARVRAVVNLRFALIIGFLLALIPVSWFLIEVMPTRLGASLMGHRFSINLYAVFILLLGRALFVWLRDEGATGRAWAFLLLFAYIGTNEAGAVLAVLALKFLQVRYPVRAVGGHLPLLTGAAVCLFWAGLNPVLGESAVRAAGYAAAAFALIVGIEACFRLPRATFAGASVAALLLAVPMVQDTAGAYERQILREADAADISRQAQALTPADALLVTPPGFGIMRIVGRRAILAGNDFPFLDEYIVGWAERAKVSWGPEPLFSTEAVDRYRGVRDSRLAEAQALFGATHAVLFTETPTAHPVLASNATYKLVALPQPRP